MPDEEIKTLEKKLEKLRSEPPCAELVTVLNKLAFAEVRSDPGKSETHALEAHALAEEIGFHSEQARSLNALGTICFEAGKYAEALSHCRKAMDIYEQIESKTGIAAIHGTIATTYKAQGMLDKALEHYHESLRKKQESDAGKEELASCHFNIGACYSSLLRLELAQTYYDYAREIWEKLDDRPRLAFLYNNIGSVYGKKGDYENAGVYFLKALDIREEQGDKRGIASTLGNLGSLQEKLGNNEKAKTYFARSLLLYEELGNRRGYAYTCCSLSGIYTSLGRLDEAVELGKKGLKITRSLKIKDWEIHCLDNIVRLYKKKGDPEKALIHAMELNTCMEEHLNEKSMEKIAALQVQFETDKKEKEAEIYRLKNEELSRINSQLREALAHVRRLQGLLPICACCKKIRDDDGYWQQIESYISGHSAAKFSHGICPECAARLYGNDVRQDQPEK